MNEPTSFEFLPSPVLIGEQEWPEGTIPLVSICCITYNHEKYIRDCIEGFLIQKTTFPVEILIHDDASTDDTSNIIREYYLKYPKLIVPIFQKVNQFSRGVRPLISYVWPRSRGKFIALCEGDDFWVDNNKLIKQFNYFYINPSAYFICSLCLFKNKYIFPNKITDKTYFSVSYKDIFLMTSYAHTSTYFIKKEVMDHRIKFLPLNVLSGDLVVLITACIFEKKITVLNSVTSVYRFHDRGVWSSIQKKEKYISYAHSWRNILEALKYLNIVDFVKLAQINVDFYNVLSVKNFYDFLLIENKIRSIFNFSYMVLYKTKSKIYNIFCDLKYKK